MQAVFGCDLVVQYKSRLAVVPKGAGVNARCHLEEHSVAGDHAAECQRDLGSHKRAGIVHHLEQMAGQRSVQRQPLHLRERHPALCTHQQRLAICLTSLHTTPRKTNLLLCHS